MRRSMERAASERPPRRVRGARIGISGWRYEPWRGDFYPPGLPQHRELAFAAERFDSIELNGTFYSLQRPESYERWYASVPPGFLFAIKGSRYITHMLQSRASRAPLANLLASGVLALREKIGPSFGNCRPRWRSTRTGLRAFLSSCCRATRGGCRACAPFTTPRVEGRTPTRGRSREVSSGMRLEVRHASFVTPAFVDVAAQAQRSRSSSPIRPASGLCSKTSPQTSCTCGSTATRSSTRAATRARCSRPGPTRLTRGSTGKNPRTRAPSARRLQRGAPTATCSSISTMTSRCARRTTRSRSPESSRRAVCRRAGSGAISAREAAAQRRRG